MELLGSLFNDYRIIIYYDHSTDDSLDKLKEYQRKNKKMHLYINKGKLLTYRTHRIALGRNTCLDLIRQYYSNYPFFIMMDCDDRCARDLNIKILKDYLNKNNWDGLSFNYPGGYYDSWALSKLPFVLSCHHFKNGDAVKQMITKLIETTSPNKLIRCLSAFNGLAIYKTPKFINCYYDGRYRTDYIPNWMKNIHINKNPHLIPPQNLEGGLKYEDCEHRHFHLQAILKNSAKIRISPHCLFI
jgi:hypothetical protein